MVRCSRSPPAINGRPLNQRRSKVLLEPNALSVTIGWLHASAQGPLGIGALLLLLLLLKWRVR
jgi:hypothetical protein